MYNRLRPSRTELHHRTQKSLLRKEIESGFGPRKDEREEKKNMIKILNLILSYISDFRDKTWESNQSIEQFA